MKINKKIKYSLIVLLVLGEGYLVASSVLDKIKEEKDIELFCSQKCNYSSSSYFWEFSGEGATRGFTTKNECLNYCEKARQGFAFAIFNDYGPAFLENILNLLNRKQ